MGIGEGSAETPAATATASPETGQADRRGPGSGAAAGSGREGPKAAGGLERAEEPLTPRQRLTISLLHNVRYHEDRQAWFVLVNGCMNLAVLLSGTGVVATLTTRHHGWSRDIAILTAVIGAVQLIFDLGRRQFQHERLRAAFLGLYADLADDNVDATRREAGKLLAEEPPTFFALDALAFNAAQKALGRPAGTLRRVTPWQRAMKNVIRFTDTDFPEVGGVVK